MNDHTDLRLIEDYLPIEAISKEAAREKSVRKGHISTLHLWWARRPLVACRAAVYGALVPADRWVKDINVKNGEGKDVEAFKIGTKRGLNRKHSKDFVSKLCRYPKSDPSNPADIKSKRETEAAILESQKHILEAHADRLTLELSAAARSKSFPSWLQEFDFKGSKVSYEDICLGRAPRPRVLDMFAGGGAIPLEAVRLGCEAYAIDLNPVAHIIELCTLVYPQQFGKADDNFLGATGKANSNGQSTWGGLASEVRHWGTWMLERIRKEVGDLYPLIPDPSHRKRSPREAKAASKKGAAGKQLNIDGTETDELESPITVPAGFLMPIAYLWTRTVRCKNPACSATIPLIRQTWLCKKEDRSVALRPVLKKSEKRVEFEVVESTTEAGLKFDPSAFSKGGSAACPFCGTVAELDYVKEQGRQSKLGDQLVGVVAIGSSRGWVYLSGDSITGAVPDLGTIQKRLAHIKKTTGLTAPDENIAGIETFDNTLGITVRPYGITKFAELFTNRQLAFHLSVASSIQDVVSELTRLQTPLDRIRAIATLLACAGDRATDFGSKLCVWNPYKDSGTTHAFGRQTITMVWDYSEVNHFNSGNAGWSLGLDRVVAALESAPSGKPANVQRGSATRMALPDQFLEVSYDVNESFRQCI